MLTLHSSTVQQSKIRRQEYCTSVKALGQNYLDRVLSSALLVRDISDLQPSIFKCLRSFHSNQTQDQMYCAYILSAEDTTLLLARQESALTLGHWGWALALIPKGEQEVTSSSIDPAQTTSARQKR